MTGGIKAPRWDSQRPDVCRIYTTNGGCCCNECPTTRARATFAWGVTSASCEQLGRPVDSLMLFADTKSRDGGIVVVVVVVVPPLHQNDFRPVKEIDWISECAVQRLPRLVLSRFLASRHMGFFRVTYSVLDRSLGAPFFIQAAAARFCYVLCVRRTLELLYRVCASVWEKAR